MKLSLAAFLLLLLLSLILIGTATASFDYSYDDPVSKELGALRAQIPRLSVDFTVVAATFQPGNLKYWLSFIMLGLFGIVCAIITCICSVVFPTLRRCGCCGGQEPMVGFFRGPARKKPYPRWQGICLKILIFLSFLGILAFTILGLIANVTFNDNLEVSRLTARNTTETLSNKIVGLRDAFVDLSVQLNTTDATIDQTIVQFNDLVYQQSQAKNQTSELLRDIGRVNRGRFVILFLVFAVGIIAPLFVVISGAFNLKDFSMRGQGLLWYILIVMWLLLAAHFDMAVLTGDVCNSINDYVVSYNGTQSQQSSVISSGGTGIEQQAAAVFNQAQQVLQLFMRCASNETLIAGLESISSMSTTLEGQFNGMITQLDPAGSTYNYTDVNCMNALQLSFVQGDANKENSVSKSCYNLQQLVEIFNRMADLLTCHDVAVGFATIRQSACLGVVRSTDILWLCFFFLGIFETIALFVSVLGYKRFRKRLYVIPTVRKAVAQKGFVRVKLGADSSYKKLQ